MSNRLSYRMVGYRVSNVMQILAITVTKQCTILTDNVLLVYDCFDRSNDSFACQFAVINTDNQIEQLYIYI